MVDEETFAYIKALEERMALAEKAIARCGDLIERLTQLVGLMSDSVARAERGIARAEAERHG